MDESIWGLKCPTCGGTDDLVIEARTWIALREDGTDADGSDHEWDEDSRIDCIECGNSAKVFQFQIKEDSSE